MDFSWRGNSHLSALDNRHILVWLVLGGASILNHPHNVHSVDHLPKNNMLAIQERSRCRGDKELAPVRVRAGILRGLAAIVQHLII